MRRLPTLLALVLACTSSVILARAQSPGSGLGGAQRLGMMVGRFTNEGEVKPGAMGPNTPAMKFSGIEECAWTAGGVGLACTKTLNIGGTKEAETYLIYYNPIFKEFEYHGIHNTGEIRNQMGRLSGDDAWTWSGTGNTIAGKVFRTQYIMKFISKDSYEYTDEWAEPAKSMQVRMSGKCTRLAANEPASSKPPR
jgi:hypothetical protein